MPSLHLDIPSIDWIARPPHEGQPGRGKATPAVDPGGARRDHERPDRPVTGDTRQPDPWPVVPAGAAV